MKDKYFKVSKCRGNEYIQVWSRVDGFLVSLGSPEKAYKNSVRLATLEKQTESFDKIKTEFSKVNNDDFD